MMHWVMVHTLVLLGLLQTVFSIPQFTVQPANTTVIAGQDATLNCAVSGLPQGTVFNPTWKQSGVALTSGRTVGDQPRYSIVGDATREGNLQIQGAMLSDDTSYQCLIGIFGAENASSVVFLTVQVPPEEPAIDTHSNGTLITVKPPQQVVLTCRANNAKPAATITWMKGGEALIHDTPVVEVTPGENAKLWNVASSLTLNPESEDNGMEYKCSVSHPAITVSYELFVSLDVQFAPDRPTIRTVGFVEGTVVTAGTELTLTCESEGGNPLADLYWWKNDMRLDFSYTTTPTMAVNEIHVLVDRSDDRAVYTCKAGSVVLDQPLKRTITLDVVYKPAYVNITGHEEMVKAGDTVTLTCKTAPSNPAATLAWSGGGNDVQISDAIVTPDPDGGFITSKTLTLTMSNTTDRVDFVCQASSRNQLVGSAQATVSVMYPPGKPVISGNLEGLRSKRRLSLSCTAFRGNPLADLTWYKNGELVVVSAPNMGPTIKRGSTASRELMFIMDKSDNGANYSCNASNAATAQPLQAVVTLSVLFPPDSIDVTAEPAAAKEGENVTVTCQTKSSNPASDISWWQDGAPIAGGAPVTESGEYGGFITRSQLSLSSVTSANNGAVYKCRASNNELDESTNDAITLDIRYKPKISSSSGVTITSGEDFTTHTLECTADGNPEELTHTWHLNDAAIDIGSNPRLSLSDQGALVIQNITRTDGGKYMCLVSNEEGNSNITATINVNYSPAITTSDSVTVTLYAVGEIVCEADANPKPDNFITWQREGLGLSGLQREYTEGKSTLRILNVSLADGGLYACQADNGIAPPAKKDVQVIVQYKPQIDWTLPRKVAQTAGQAAILKCAAEGAPKVLIKWQQNDEDLNVTSVRYSVDTRKDQRYSNRYVSQLVISYVNEDFDYGVYKCIASNDLGEAVFTVTLEKTSAPDAPSELSVVSVKDDEITLTWVPGFDGGLAQSFTVRFSKKDSVQYQYVDVSPPNATIFTITSLSPGTEYELTVRGKNTLGPGPFFADIISEVTNDKPTSPPGPDRGILVGNLPLYLFLLVVFLLLISCVFINVFLCCCLVKKARSKRELGKSGVQLERVQRRESQDSAPTETRSVDSLSQRDSDRDRGYSTDDDHEFDDRRYPDDYSDSRDYSVSDRYTDDRPIVPRGSRTYRPPAEPSYYNTGYRPPSFAPSWDSYGAVPSISGMTADSRISEEQDERDYIEKLRRKQLHDGSSRAGGYRGSATPSPVPSSLGNFVQLSKGAKAAASVAGSEEGFLV